MIEYKYIKFDKIEEKTKTAVYECATVNAGTRLGIVRWYAGWRQYCFIPKENTIFSKGCLEDISDFIQKITEDRK